MIAPHVLRAGLDGITVAFFLCCIALACGAVVLGRAIIRSREAGAELEARTAAAQAANETGHYPPSQGNAAKIAQETGK